MLLTGGLGLLGKAIACDLDERGFHVIVVDIHNSTEELNKNIDEDDDILQSMHQIVGES